MFTGSPVSGLPVHVWEQPFRWRGGSLYVLVRFLVRSLSHLTVSQSDAADGTGPPFLADAAKFIRQQPTPWTESTKKFVAFMFGVASHQVRAAQSGADGAQRL